VIQTIPIPHYSQNSETLIYTIKPCNRVASFAGEMNSATLPTCNTRSADFPFHFDQVFLSASSISGFAHFKLDEIDTLFCWINFAMFYDLKRKMAR
jgi:hypothetical protein